MSDEYNRLNFPDVFGGILWRDDDEGGILWRDDDDDGEAIAIPRRPYRLLNHRDVNHWDDADFFVRFRFTKPTFYYILGMVGPSLAFDPSR